MPPALTRLLFGLFLLLPFLTSLHAQRQVEHLNRGLIALPLDDTRVLVGWRFLGTDPIDLGFDLYRAVGDGAPQRLNPSPITAATTWFDESGARSAPLTYTLHAAGQPAPLASIVLPAATPANPWVTVPLDVPPPGNLPDGTPYTYVANDCSVGDLDGDGTYELIVKWDPSNAKDNSQSGHTGNVYLDAYRIDPAVPGRLWRIDLGVNIRAGAHYTQFQVFDLDGDGRAEIACRTAEGSRDGLGSPVAQADRFLGPRPAIDHAADRRNPSGYILTGPEFLTVFDGRTGAELASTSFTPPRVDGTDFPTPTQINAVWGDNYGNRVDRFLAGIAYLDGRRPSLVFSRGYYTRTVVAAYDWRDGALTRRWVFDTDPGGAAGEFATYRGQGNHQFTVADVDADGRDEIVFGACTIDDDGTGLYSTGLGHGDALHVTDIDPDRPGLEVFGVHESPSSYGTHGSGLRDARTGVRLHSVSGEGTDIGRGLAADIDPRHPGLESWASRGGLHAANGTPLTSRRPGSINFAVWWDGDLLRELLDGTTVSKWNWETETTTPLLQATGCASNNSTKATPALTADLFGDWREEIVWRTADNTALRIYTSPLSTEHRLPTLMHDPAYRTAVAGQNSGYNQPPHPGFHLGHGMEKRASADIETTAANPAAATRLANLSIRTQGGSGAETLTVGFVLEGNEDRALLLRGVGPTLAAFEVSGTMPDPRLVLYRSTQQGPQVQAANAAWTDDGQASTLAATATAVGAFPLRNPSQDSALLRNLSGGAYTVELQPGGSIPGVALAELYALEAPGGAALVNASSRARAGAGDRTLVLGFVLTGDRPRRVLVRAIGPTLGDFGLEGALADPRLDLYRATADGPLHLAGNDDWAGGSGASLSSFGRLGAFALPPQSRDAALLLNLSPGAYTAHCGVADSAEGVALVELYLLP